MAPALEAAGLRGYEDFVKAHDGDDVARSRTTETRRLTIRHAGTAHTLYLKVYRYDTGHRRPWFVRDKASIEAENYRLLRGRYGVAPPELIAFGSRRRGAWRRDAFIVTRAVADAVPLDEYARRRCPAGNIEAAERRRRLLERTADVIADMHAAGFFHIDLQWRNVLVCESAAGGLGIYLIDCTRGGLRRSRPRQWHGRLRDLSSLYKMAGVVLSRTEQVRWLRRYLGVRRLRALDRVLVQAIRYDRGIKDDGIDA